eukprot:CAMPEP_0172482466 /NCGR_PEP_ID=MMETSP1066-20121228/8888_1 /TAXON_ID=671091 /ORGANISM="Coscinodiscus wailesii, Strain CCMP2513" /LENGTH=353 /DNA_ID=CAMNT_0013245603 /DNA_START=131 /DNA_END=1192 /DNA_ORIENTATION=+
MASNANEPNSKEVEMGALLGNEGASKPNDTESHTTGQTDSEGRETYHPGKVITACSLYSTCSVGMVLVNKSLASSYNHLIDGNLNILLVVFQAITAVFCVQVCKTMGWVEYPAFNMRTARQWAPVNILFCFMLFTGMASLQHNTVPLVTVFKNITNIFIAAGEYYLFNKPAEFLVMVAFGIMLGGAIAAAWNDIYITGIGLFWMIGNCFSTAGYVLYLKFATKTVKLSKFGMVFYNNVLCVLFLLPVASAMGELRIFLTTEALHTVDYGIKNFFAGFVGFFLNFASLNCVSITGPTTYAIVGSLNKIPTSIFGWFLFHAQISSETWFFIAISMIGGFVYSYAKIKGSRNQSGK